MESPEMDPMLGEVMDGKQDNFSPGFLVIPKNKMTSLEEHKLYFSAV